MLGKNISEASKFFDFLPYFSSSIRIGLYFSLNRFLRNRGSVIFPGG